MQKNVYASRSPCQVFSCCEEACCIPQPDCLSKCDFLSLLLLLLQISLSAALNYKSQIRRPPCPAQNASSKCSSSTYVLHNNAILQSGSFSRLTCCHGTCTVTFPVVFFSRESICRPFRARICVFFRNLYVDTLHLPIFPFLVERAKFHASVTRDDL